MQAIREFKNWISSKSIRTKYADYSSDRKILFEKHLFKYLKLVPKTNVEAAVPKVDRTPRRLISKDVSKTEELNSNIATLVKNFNKTERKQFSAESMYKNLFGYN